MIKRPLTEIKLEMEDVEKFKQYLAQAEHQKSTQSSKPSVKTSLFGGAATHGKNIDDSFPIINASAASIPGLSHLDSVPRATTTATTEASRRVAGSLSPLDQDPTASFAERLRREAYPDVPVANTPAGQIINRNLVRQLRLGFSPEVMTNPNSPMNSTPGANVAQYR